ACAAAVSVSALKSVDLPTFGNPTMPHLKPMDFYFTWLDGDSRGIAIGIFVRFFAEAFGDHGEVHFVLKARILAARQELRVVGKDTAQRPDPAALPLGEIAEYVMLPLVLVAGMPDADAHAPIVVADMLGDRAQAVVAGDAAADLDPHLGRPQVNLVVK